jgi:hypothetical protein
MKARTLALALAAVALGVTEARSGEIPGALVVLETYIEVRPGDSPEAAPPRFVLLQDGQVFVGGSSQVVAGRLTSSETKAIEKRLSTVRRLSGLGSSVNLGPGAARHRLQLRKGRPLEIVATGDPAGAPRALQPLASLIADLGSFDHSDLKPYPPKEYWLTARLGSLPGGCRPWPFPEPLTEGSRTVPASDYPTWPTGARPASVCAGGKSFVVTLRPLLPGEKP